MLSATLPFLLVGC